MAVEPVRRAARAEHRCPVSGCPILVPRTHLMCARHWYTVPRALRTRVWRAWDGGAGAGSPEHNESTWLAVLAVERQLEV